MAEGWGFKERCLTCLSSCDSLRMAAFAWDLWKKMLCLLFYHVFFWICLLNHLLEHLEQPSEANQRWMFWTSFKDIRIRFGKLKTLRLSDDEPEYFFRLSLSRQYLSFLIIDIKWAMKKSRCLGYIGDEILPTCLGIRIRTNHYKDPVLKQPVYHGKLESLFVWLTCDRWKIWKRYLLNWLW